MKQKKWLNLKRMIPKVTKFLPKDKTTLFDNAKDKDELKHNCKI